MYIHRHLHPGRVFEAHGGHGDATYTGSGPAEIPKSHDKVSLRLEASMRAHVKTTIIIVSVAEAVAVLQQRLTRRHPDPLTCACSALRHP